MKPNLFSVICSLVVCLCGCSGAIQEPLSWQDESVDLVWPEPPDVPRIRYLRSFSGPADFKEKSRNVGLMSWLLGDLQEDPPFVSPFSVAVSRSGSIWIADNGAGMLYRLDPDARRVDYLQRFSDIQLVTPSGIAVDDDRQRVFLADSSLLRVIVLDLNGKYLESWEPEEGFGRPAGLAIDAAGRLLVADAKAGIVYVFSSDGAVLSKIQSKANPDGRFGRALNVALGPQGEILILDAFSFRVEVQDAQGELLGTIGQLGDSAGYLARPKGLAVDQEGHVFVSDAAFDNVQVFDMAGNLLMFWGGAGRDPGRFNLPGGLFVDHQRRFYVADSYNHRVQVFQLLP